MLRRSFLKGTGLLLAATALPAAAMIIEEEKPKIYSPDLTATIRNHGVRLAWSIPDLSDYKSSRIYRNGIILGDTVTTRFLDDEVRDLTTYTYFVVIRLGGKEITSSSVSVTTKPSLNAVRYDTKTSELYRWNDTQQKWIK